MDGTETATLEIHLPNGQAEKLGNLLTALVARDDAAIREQTRRETAEAYEKSHTEAWPTLDGLTERNMYLSVIWILKEAAIYARNREETAFLRDADSRIVACVLTHCSDTEMAQFRVFCDLIQAEREERRKRDTDGRH